MKFAMIEAYNLSYRPTYTINSFENNLYFTFLLVPQGAVKVKHRFWTTETVKTCIIYFGMWEAAVTNVLQPSLSNMSY